MLRKYIAKGLIFIMVFALIQIIELPKPIQAAPQTVSTLGNLVTAGGSSGRIFDLETDGTVTYLAGEFKYVGPSTGFAVPLNTTTGAVTGSYPKVGGFDYDSVSAIASDGSGGWYLGGDFPIVDGASHPKLIHVTSSGTLDTTWAPASNGTINTIVVSGSSVFVGGSFTSIGGLSRNYLAKLNNTTGAADASWNPNPNGAIVALAVSGTSLYVSGSFTGLNSIGGTTGLTRNRLAKLVTTDGTLDTSWNPAPTSQVDSIAIDGSDIYVAGAFNGVTSIGGANRNYLAKLNDTTGAADGTWDPNPNGTSSDIVILGTSVYVGGAFTTIGGQSLTKMAKLNKTTGASDVAWAPNPNGSVLCMIALGSSIYVGGYFDTIDAQSRYGIAKLDSTNGDLDTTWNPMVATDMSVYAMQTDGTTIYIGGDFPSVGGSTRNRLAAINNATGELTSWNPNANNEVDAIAISGSDIYVGGLFSIVGGQTLTKMAKLNNTTGAADASWNPAPNGQIQSRGMVVSGTSVYVAGSFTTIGGQSRNKLAKISTTTGLADASWAPSASGTPLTIVVSGSDIYSGGSGGLRKLDPTTGANDATWLPAPNGTVRGLAISDGYLYVSGDFSTIGGQSRNRAARIAIASNASGNADATWNPNIGCCVYSMTPTSDKVYISGYFSTANGGTSRNYLAVVNKTNGNLVGTWNPSISGYEVYDVVESSNIVFVAGYFYGIDTDQPHWNLARFVFPKIGFTSATGSGSESSISPTLAVSLNTAADLDTSVSYSVTGGTATGSGTDYTLASGSVTILEGQTSATISLSINNDNDQESSETIQVTLASPVDSFLDTNTVLTYTITDNDVPNVGGGTGSGAGGCVFNCPNTTGPTPAESSVLSTHPLGTIINDNGTLYTITTAYQGPTVRRPYTSAGAFLSYGFNHFEDVVSASTEDLALPVGDFIPPQDGSIVCSDRSPDQGTCYFITQGQKAGFVTESVFRRLGYSFDKVAYGDVSFLPTHAPIEDNATAHLPGAVINNNGRIQIVGTNSLYDFDSESTFSSWGYKLENVVPATAEDQLKSVSVSIPARQNGQIRYFYE